MAEYIERESFLEQKREQYCKDCASRKGMKNGKYKTLYEIGEAPCRACGIDDMLNDVEDFPAADVRPVVRGKFEYRGQKVIDDLFPTYACSNCHGVIPADWKRKCNYCPNCGARMEES